MRLILPELTDIETSDWPKAKTALGHLLRRWQAAINTTWEVSHHVDGTQISASKGKILGQLTGTLAEAQTLTPTTSDDGMLVFITDFGHLVRWTGTAWAFAPGESGSGYFQDFAITPQASGWVLCNGSVTTYLVVGGAALSETSFTTPNLTGTPAYRKSIAAYTGVINAKQAPAATGTGTTGTGTTGTDITGTGTTGTGVTGIRVGNIAAGTGALSATGDHDHTIPGLSIPALSVPGLSVPGLSVPGLSIGAIEMANLGVLPYFRR